MKFLPLLLLCLFLGGCATPQEQTAKKMAPRFASWNQQYQKGMVNRTVYEAGLRDLNAVANVEYQNILQEQRARQQLALDIAQGINASAQNYQRQVAANNASAYVPYQAPVAFRPVIDTRAHYMAPPAPTSYRYVPNAFNQGGTIYPNPY